MGQRSPAATIVMRCPICIAAPATAAALRRHPARVGSLPVCKHSVAPLGDGRTNLVPTGARAIVVGDSEYRDVPRHARAQVALAAAAFGRWAVDSVHLDIADEAGQRAEALDAVALGFVATACIHPSQVAVVRGAYAPDDDEVAWARKVLAAAENNQGVFRLDGRMVDGPVFRQAEATLRRAAAATI